MRCLVESLFRVAGLEVVDQLLCALADSLADGALRVGRGRARYLQSVAAA